MPLASPFHPRTSALCESLRFKEWAGYFAVASYDGHSDAEYFAFRNAAGLLDVSPLYKYEVTGPDSAAFLGYVATRDVSRLAPGRVTYTCFCDAAGKVIDDGTIARLDDHRFRATTASPTFGWFERNRRGFAVTITDVSDRTAALALQGPFSRAVLEDLVGPAIRELGFFRIASATIAGVDVEISRTGFTGDLGYEIWIPAPSALPVWDAILEAGHPHGLRPAGLDALDVTRIEAGFVLQDVDYFSAPRCLIESRKSSPFEIGLGWTVDLDRDLDRDLNRELDRHHAAFVGQAALRTEKAQGSVWNLVGLEIDWAGIEELYGKHGLPPHLSSHASRDAVPVYVGSRQFGQVTSSTWSPLLKKYLALATVASDYATSGTELRVEHTVEFERTTVKATVVDRPFFDPERKRALPEATRA